MADENASVVNPFGPSQLVAAPDGASAQALVQREVGEVQAAIVIAKRFPRDQKACMDKILMSCTRMSLAEVSTYQYKRGSSVITGPSIRMAEELARSWGNLASGVVELSRAGGQSDCMAYAWDLETNTREERRFTVRHWRDTKEGGYPLREERDIYEIVANQGARRRRACILALIPGDVVDAALEQCAVTIKTKVDITPETIKKMVETFAESGVTRAMIERRIQRPIDVMEPMQYLGLRRVYASIRDGIAKVSDFFEAEIETSPGGPTEAPSPQAGVAGVKSRLKGVAKPIADVDAQPPEDHPR